MASISAILHGAVSGLYDRLMSTAEPDLREGDLYVAFSVGESRASTRVELAGKDLPEVIRELETFDPETQEITRDMSVPEVIRQTLSVEREPASPKDLAEGKQGKITAYNFKASNRPHSRTVVVPAEDWKDFIQFLKDVNGNKEKLLKKLQGLTGAVSTENKGQGLQA